MSKEIKQLKPDTLWGYFYDLTQIPRPSKKESGAVTYMKDFGEKLGLETLVDEVGNVIIRRPAASGMEDRQGIILQGHLDMVPQANSDSTHNFETDPIKAYVDGEWVTAEGTTLGADNGIGVAAAMSILADPNLKLGMVEGLFTVDEETGMTGAFNLKAGLLQGDILMNLDSEDEGELYVGCAGGTNANINLDFKKEKPQHGMTGLQISISGLKGGHSGIDIPLERGNSNKILFRFLFEAIRKYNIGIGEISGGSLRNAIPREAFAQIAVQSDQASNLIHDLKVFEATVKNELLSADPGVTLSVVKIETPDWIMDPLSADHLVKAIYACPNGVVRMSTDMKGLVETSTNLAIVKTEKDQVFIKCLLRSSVDTAKEDLKNSFVAVFELAGAHIGFDGEYPGWKPNMESPVLKTAQSVYKNKYDKIPEIKAIHAGLECGILGGAYPHWDMISFGPTIRFPHSPDEKVNIATVEKFYDFLVELVKAAPRK